MAAYKLVALTLVLAVGLTVCLPSIASADNMIEQILKLFGISFVVRQFGGEINDFINGLTGQHGVKWEGTTKVVPIISVGAGTRVGAAQVQGPTDRVDKVRGVGQLETRIGGIRGKMLLPVSTTTPTADVKRIKGVGVSALIDFKI